MVCTETNLPPIVIDPQGMFETEYALPPLPAVAIKIRELIETDDCDAREVAELVAAEPALVARLLRLVNSAYYGLPREVSDVRFAIAFVGLGEIYRIVMALAVIESIGVTDQGELEDFWYHSYLSTLIAKDVAVHYLSYLPLDELWSAALLHDIGRLVYARFFPEHLQAIRAYAQDQGCTLDSAESALELPSSALLGESICRHWGLPQRVRDACAHHHLSDLAGITQDGTLRGDFIRTVGIGHVLSEMCLEKLSDAYQRDITNRVMENLGCDEPAFLDLIARVYACREEVNAFIRHML